MKITARYTHTWFWYGKWKDNLFVGRTRATCMQRVCVALRHHQELRWKTSGWSRIKQIEFSIFHRSPFTLVEREGGRKWNCKKKLPLCWRLSHFWLHSSSRHGAMEEGRLLWRKIAALLFGVVQTKLNSPTFLSLFFLLRPNDDPPHCCFPAECGVSFWRKKIIKNENVSHMRSALKMLLKFNFPKFSVLFTPFTPSSSSVWCDNFTRVERERRELGWYSIRSRNCEKNFALFRCLVLLLRGFLATFYFIMHITTSGLPLLLGFSANTHSISGCWSLEYVFTACKVENHENLCGIKKEPHNMISSEAWFFFSEEKLVGHKYCISWKCYKTTDIPCYAEKSNL